MKKTWQAPQLIILTRSRPEEAVLTSCKDVIIAGGSPTTAQWACDGAGICLQCNTIVQS